MVATASQEEIRNENTPEQALDGDFGTLAITDRHFNEEVWFEVTLPARSRVGQIVFYGNSKDGGAPLRLDGARVLVDGTLCGTIKARPNVITEIGQAYHVYCRSTSDTQYSSIWGVSGNSVRVSVYHDRDLYTSRAGLEIKEMYIYEFKVESKFLFRN